MFSQTKFMGCAPYLNKKLHKLNFHKFEFYLKKKKIAQCIKKRNMGFKKKKDSWNASFEEKILVP